MTARNNCAVLKDVIAYVDVWSSDKTANFSKPFVQQLQEMGAQVTKTFNKHVTHVVFKNGHMTTWRKAKKSDVKLVSVLWVGRCYEDGVHASEELYPALDETNPLFKSKKHRCMQPKDSPERTPENDRRLRKKLDRMMKELIPIQPLVPEVSPIIIDEENGIVYSPGLKRSDYMAQRLKDMKEKRENLSPTASQIVESCSPTGLKPSLGNTPTHLKLPYEQSDDDSSASVAEPADSTDKKEARTQHNITEHRHPEERQRKASEKPWLAARGDVPKRISSPSKCLDFSDHENEDETTLKEKPTEKHKQSFRGLSESSSKDRTSDSQKDANVEKMPSLRKSFRSSPKSAKGKRKNGTTKSCSETNIIPDIVKSSGCLSKPASLDDAIVEPSKETSTSKKTARRTPKAARLSLSSLVQCVTLSGGSKSVASSSADGDDDVFEDYFSPANSHRKSKKLLLPHLPEEGDTQIPFELGSVPKKRKQNRESTGSENNHSKKKKLEESQRGRGSTVAAGFAKIPSEGEDDNKQVSLSLQKMVSKTMGIRTLVMTSMPTEKQHIVVQLVKTLGGFSIIDRVCESTTHVVSGGHRRTLNILLGITRGCWILSFEWILWCLEQRQWIPEEPYELSDQFPAAQICRLQRHLSAGEHQQDLFQSQPPMFVSQHSQPPAHSLVELIELCGGTVCKTVRQAGICIGKYSGRRPEGSRILSEQWVLDSITHLKLLPYDDYILE